MSDTITQVPRLVRVGMAVAMGVALPVAVLRAAPDVPGSTADTATDHLPATGANDLTVPLPGLSASEPPAARLGGGAIASADGIVAAALSTPFIPQAAVTASVFGHTTGTAHTGATTAATHVTSHQSPTAQPDATDHEPTSTSTSSSTISHTTAKPVESTDSTEKADDGSGTDDAACTTTQTPTPHQVTAHADDEVAAEHLSMWKVPTVHDLVAHPSTTSSADSD